MDWIDRTLFPLQQTIYRHSEGNMAYVDVGQGPVIVCVHGTPTWSILWRHAIHQLSQHNRVIALDHLGFGASDKPVEGDYTLNGHARRFQAFITDLGLDQITLVVHDYGGPIGLADAIAHPGRYCGIVLLNTFLWPFRGAFTIPRAAKLLHSPLGRYLYLTHNVSPRWLLPNVFGDKNKLTPAVHLQYQAPFPDPHLRHALWACVEELEHATPWLQQLWEQRHMLTNIPASIVWGMSDPVYGAHFLRQWQQLFPNAPVTPLAQVGHFVQEESPQHYVDAINRLIEEHRTSYARL